MCEEFPCPRAREQHDGSADNGPIHVHLYVYNDS